MTADMPKRATTTKTERTVIAAAPGYSLAVYACHDGRESIALEPIIGWAVALDVVDGPRFGRLYTKHEIEPLVIGGSVHDIEVPWALKRPDGLYQLIEGGSAGDEKEMLDWFRQENRRLGRPTPLVK